METMKDIKAQFASAKEGEYNALFQHYENDERSGVQKLIQQYRKKLQALENDGLKVITVTTSQLASASAMRHVAQEAHARRGTRLRLRCKNFALRQKRLYQLRWSMDDYLDEGWVAAQRSCCRSSALHAEVF